eukprot:66420_1
MDQNAWIPVVVTICGVVVMLIAAYCLYKRYNSNIQEAIKRTISHNKHQEDSYEEESYHKQFELNFTPRRKVTYVDENDNYQTEFQYDIASMSMSPPCEPQNEQTDLFETEDTLAAFDI